MKNIIVRKFNQLLMLLNRNDLAFNFKYQNKIVDYLIDKSFDDRALYFSNLDEYMSCCVNYAKQFNNRINIECGIGKGRNARLLCELLPDQVIYGFDSFQGFKEDPSVESVWAPFHDKFKKWRKPDLPKNYHIIEGFLEDTFEPFYNKIRNEEEFNCIFVHLDMDIYEPTKHFLSIIRKEEIKTIICFDELINYEGFENHEWRAFNEEILRNNIPHKVIAFSDAGKKLYGPFVKFCIEIF